MNEEQQQRPNFIPPQLNSTPLPPQAPNVLDNQDFFKYRIESKEIIAEIEHQLKGEELDSYGQWVAKHEPWANDEGINKITHIIYSSGVNRHVFLANLKKDEIMYKCKSIKKKLARLLFKDYEDLGVKRRMRDLLISNVVNIIHYGLSRSEGGKEAHQLSTASQRHDIYNHDDVGKQGWVDKMLGRQPNSKY